MSYDRSMIRGVIVLSCVLCDLRRLLFRTSRLLDFRHDGLLGVCRGRLFGDLLSTTDQQQCHSQKKHLRRNDSLDARE